MKEHQPHRTFLTMLTVAGLGLSATSGCNRAADRPSTAPAGSSVESAYAELVSAFADCAKSVSECARNAQGDASALASCRDAFATCRDSAGQASVNAIADAVRGCTATHRACVAASGDAGAASCEDGLSACLAASHPAHPDSAKNDDDAGEDHGQGGDHGAAVGDCIDALHACVSGGGAPQDCARDVRACVLDSLPTPDQVIPGGPSQPGEHAAAGHGGTPDMHSDAGHGADDTHGAAGHSGDPNEHAADAGKPADVPKGSDAGAAASAPALACLDTFQSCVSSGGSARTCAQALKQCMADTRP